jgi:Uma2 family endonuclease
MTAAPKRKLTEAEYLEIENAAEFKHDFYNGEMFAMAGASPQHNAIKDNLILEVGSRLRGSRCRTFSSDQRVKMDQYGQYTYPDVIVQCLPPEYDTVDPNSLINPTVIIEILSPSTERYDRNIKQVNYRSIATLREIVLVSQTLKKIDRFYRRDDGSWSWDVFTESEGDFTFESVPVTVSLADIYRGVELLPEPQPFRSLPDQV